MFDEQQIADSDPGAFQDLDLSSPYSVKSGRFRTMTKKEIHEALGHFGYLESCLFCLEVKKSLNRIYKNPRTGRNMTQDLSTRGTQILSIGVSKGFQSEVTSITWC